MENEGIMALPQGAGMPEPQAPMTVSSADAYDAAKTALGMTNPQALEEVKASLRENLADVDLTPREIDQLISVFEYLTNNPQDYQRVLQQLLAQDMVDPGDLPEEYDPVFVGAALAVLNELKMSQAEGAMQPMMEGPPIAPPMGPAPMAMAQGGLADMAGYLASQGRNGDTMLAHITPDEAAMLEAQGGSGTINPNTGLPEYFKKFFKKLGNAVKKVLSSPIGRIIGTIALAAVLGPTSIGLALGQAGTAALSAGAVTLGGGGSIKDALVSAALGYVGGGGTIGGFSPLQSVGSVLPGAAGSALNTGLTTAALGTGAGLAMGMKPKEALKMGATAGLVSGGLQAVSGPTAQAAQQAGAPAEMAGAPAPTAPSGGIGQIGTAAQQPMMQNIAGEMGTGTYSPSGEIVATPSAPSVAGEMGTTASTPYSASGQLLPPGSNPAQPGFFGRMAQGATDLYNEYLSPSRPGLPADAGLIRKYAPLAAAGTAVAGALGAFKTPPTEEEPLYSNKAWMQRAEQERLSREQQLANVDYGLTRGIPMPPAPQAPMPAAPMPASPMPTTPPIFNPAPATPGFGPIAQPYNVPGLYGIPLLYGPQPVRAARGGEMRPTEFPRKIGAINGPGTGTSDSIPAMLSDGEFVFTAKAVRNAGGGSRRKGAARMYKMMKMLEGGPVKGK
jgi:hypothetical protein